MPIPRSCPVASTSRRCCAYVRSAVTLRSRLLRLGTQARIREHTDFNLGYEDDEIRVHIPVATNPQVEFYLNGSRVQMNAGECWYLNFNLPHRLYNGGTTGPACTLVIDCSVNAWVRNLF